MRSEQVPFSEMTDDELMNYRALVTGETIDEVLAVFNKAGRDGLFPDQPDTFTVIADHQGESK